MTTTRQGKRVKKHINIGEVKIVQVNSPCGWCKERVYTSFGGVCLKCWDTVKELVLERRKHHVKEEI